jgi:hypothetical protein
MVTGEVVFFGRPTGPEVVIRDFANEAEADPGIQIMGQAFVVTQPVKGEFEAMLRVTVIRTHLVDATTQPQPPFSHLLYLLAVRSTGNSYGLPAWYTIAGPSGRIPFDLSASGALVSVVESQGNEIQVRLAGMTQEQVIEAIRG